MPLRAKLRKAYFKVAVLFNRARLKLQPESSESRLSLAQSYIQQSAWASALNLAEQILREDANNAEAYQTIAQAYQGQNLPDQAIVAIRQAIALKPDSPWFHQDLGKIYLAKEDYSAAIAAFQKAVELDNQIAWSHFHLGETLVKAGYWAEAIVPLQQAIQLNPVFPWNYYYLGEAYLALEIVDAAIAQYRKAITVAPDIPYLQEALAYAKHWTDQAARIQAFCQQFQATPRSQPLALLLTPHPPYPPKQGVAMRIFYEMKALHEQTDLAVVFFGFAKADLHYEQDLVDWSQLAIMQTIGDRRSDCPIASKAVQRYSSVRMTKLLKQLSVVNFDIVVMDFIFMAQYRHLFPQAFTVLSEHNIESQLLQRTTAMTATPESMMAAQSLADFETQMWPQFDLRLVVSELDRQMLQQRSPEGSTLVVNNGINTQEIKPFVDNPIPRLLFMGTMNYAPNVDGVTYFIQEILPEIWQRNSQVACWIAGATPSPEIYDLVNDPRIQVIANPDSMEAIAAQCCLTIVPLRIGGGTRIKILHSMAMGLPVVSTSLGCEGLNVVDNQHLLIRDQPIAFAEAVVQLVNDANLRQTLRTQGRQLVEQHYDWDNIFRDAVAQILTHWNGAKLR
jgi:tetratricopeptide (TPR) repeat protein